MIADGQHSSNSLRHFMIRNPESSKRLRQPLTSQAQFAGGGRAVAGVPNERGGDDAALSDEARRLQPHAGRWRGLFCVRQNLIDVTGRHAAAAWRQNRQRRDGVL